MELLQGMEELAREGGRIMLSAHHISAREKTGDADLVTEYDLAVQETIRTGLARLLPDARFVGEESKDNRSPSEGKCFVVDPIDGTTNFIKNYRHSAVSIAYLENGQVERGVVYDPYQNEMFCAKRGKGAFVNQTQIFCSQVPLSHGVIGIGTCPYYVDLRTKTLAAAAQLIKQCQDLRRGGSVALDLCYTAAGRLDGFFELQLSPWDYAAGSLIVTEAGGVITNLEGNFPGFDVPSPIVAGNPLSVPSLLKLLASM